jgi:hypothetical protein
LPAWLPLLPPDTVFLCIFRHPGVTVQSILTECRGHDYMASLRIDAAGAYRVWCAMYGHVMAQYARPELTARWSFVHYDQVLSGDALPALADFLEAPLVHGFADPDLRRSRAAGPVPERAYALYGKLCRLAGYASGAGESGVPERTT